MARVRQRSGCGRGGVRQYFGGRVYRRNYWEASLTTQPSDDVSVGVFVKWGDQIAFANARGGTSIEVGPTMQLRLGRHLDVNIQHRLERLTVGGARVFTANLAQTRAVYNFSSRAFLRGIVQLRHTAREPARYREPVDRASTNLFTQLLFSYRIDARTGLFLGLADNRAGMHPESDLRVPLTQRDRTFFVKLSYAWHR